MTAVLQAPDWLVDQQFSLSVVLSLVVVSAVWWLDALLARYGLLETQTIDDLRGFRGVAAATVAVLSLSWIGSQPAPSWLDEAIGSSGAGAVWEGTAEFLPRLLVQGYRPLLVTLLGAWWVWKLRSQGDDVIERFVARRYDEALAPIVENVWDISVLAVFVLLVLDQWGIRIAALLAPAGIIGIVLGFAARETVANFFGSLSLYADDTYERGDYIELEGGVSGTVRDISVRSTVLQTLDGDLVNVPNSELNEAKITNKSSPTTSRRIRSRIGVSYDASPNEAKGVLRDAADTVSETRSPTVRLRSFGDSAIVYDVFVWIADPADRIPAKDDLNVALYRALQEADLEIPYPQREVTVEESIDQRETSPD